MDSRKASSYVVDTEIVQYGTRKGWRSGIFRGIVLVSLVFAANLFCTIWAVSKSQSIGQGQRVVMEGDCNEVKHLESSLHLVINILSTIILGASNYAMQCLSAPTRQEVDEAHQKRVWLDIGVLSVRNLRRISGRRMLLWILLGLSSLPLHLFYNSTIYSSIYSADYAIFMTTEDNLVSNATSHTLGIDVDYPYIEGSNQTTIGYYWGDIDVTSNYTLVNVTSMLYASALANNLTRLNNSECISRYSNTFPTSQGNLILVTSNATQTPYAFGYLSMQPIQDLDAGCPPDPFSWVCNQIPSDGLSCNQRPACGRKLSKVDPNDWAPFGNKIDYCLSEDVEEKCVLALNVPLVIIVMVFNVLKAGLLIYTFWVVKDNPLMMLGDAIASFLGKRDDTTREMCLLGRDDLEDWKKSLSEEHSPPPKQVDASRRRWSSVVSKSRWISLMTMYIVMLGICIILLLHGLFGRVAAPMALLKLPIGGIDPRTFIQGWNIPDFGISGLLSNVFMANSPQLLLSMIYFTYNSLFTSFLLGAEWNSLSTQRKGLRVSDHPTGSQRATYFLQLPFRWATPLIVLSAILHWLCSQSIYLVSIEFDHTVYQSVNEDGSLSCWGVADDIGTSLTECYDRYFTCGYSPVAILATISLGIAMVIFALLVGLKRYDNGSMPVAGSCSAAISASCHLLDTDEDNQDDESGERAASSSLQWGEFDTPLITVTHFHTAGDGSKEYSEASQHVYHCGFSHREVRVPDENRLYA